jgi:hypothetical protein
VAVPAEVAAAFEVVQAEAVFEPSPAEESQHSPDIPVPPHTLTRKGRPR